MVFSRIASHNEYAIANTNIGPTVGHCTPSERLSQSRYSGAVSETGLMIHIDDSETSQEFDIEKALIILDMATSYPSNTIGSVDHLAFIVFLDETGITTLLNSLGYFRESPIPGFGFPFRAVGGTVQNLCQSILVGYKLIE
jgi:hypothetical protein